MLLSPEKASEMVGYEITANVENTSLKSIVTYTSKPLGKDPVIVELYACNETRSAEDVYAIFKEKREKRPNSQDIDDFGMECFIAYPSINFYCDGYMAVVTAGSGSDETQTELLKNIGGMVAENLKKCL